jgi:hypothetical protein
MEKFYSKSKTYIRTLLLSIPLILLAFTTGDNKSEYILPLKANSVCAVDLDLDGDMDIVVGHNYNTFTEWSGISISLNEGSGYFYLFDSIYLYGGQSNNKIINLNENPLPEIIGKFVALNPVSEHIAIIYDFNVTNILYFDLFTDEGVGFLETGDINGDSKIDIVVASNGGKFWGILYNDGTGNFTEPEYYDTGSYPTDLKCADLNNDGKDDIIIASSQVEIYYSSTTGFVYDPVGNGADQVTIADFDHDLDFDILANAGFGITSLTFYENIDGNEFIIHDLPSFQPNLGNLYSADFNNDSLPDVLLEDVLDLYIFYNEGDFSLSEPSVFLIDEFYLIIHRFGFGDFDNNGYQDIAFTRQLGVYDPNLKILFNDGNGNFLEDPITGLEVLNAKNKMQMSCDPNPFTTETTIEIKINENEFTELSVYNLSGKKVKILTNKITEGGITKIKWDGFDNDGKPCKPGPYLLTLMVNGKVLQTIKLIKQ